MKSKNLQDIVKHWKPFVTAVAVPHATLYVSVKKNMLLFMEERAIMSSMRRWEARLHEVLQ